MPEIRTHEGLDIRLQEWFNSLNNNDENTLIVAIARKSPRLYEYCEMMWGGGSSSQRLFIVSEHALPFLFQHNFAEKYHKVILVDEAIYNGTTWRLLCEWKIYVRYRRPVDGLRTDQECGKCVCRYTRTT